MTDEPKQRKPRKAKPSAVELRLRDGAVILKTPDQEARGGAYYTFADTGRVARADVIERLIAAGKLKPRHDGLFAECSQTWAFA